MKQITCLFMGFTFFMCSCTNNAETANTTTSENKDKPTDVKVDTTPPQMMDSAAMAKAWMDFMTPSAMHKWLEKTNGTWVAEELNQWTDPNLPPTKSKATNVQSSVLGGRYVIGKFSGMAMGQPMEGMSTMGYDNAKKVFVSTWIDNMGSGIVHMSGTYDEATKTLHLKGHQTDPMTGKESDMREEMKTIDDNSYSMAIFGAGPGGKEMKFMEGVFKKKN